ncbi:energy transducer TonB [Marinicauda algicola]|uniref:Protein TonB n=1 Tax=Marinicauda algicola TaxID=2029849 RepID=A0A4S2GXK3_9PROT|nr:energy transducer TonB [Marinicauda algicola]TGY87628.1 energy transducer TonB [Marinicauda algicola]
MKKISSLMAIVAMGAGLVAAPAALAQEPELVEVAAPEYPRGAERRELEGYVTVRYNITDTGEIADVEVVEQTPEGVFDRAVLRALESWRYAPGVTATGIEKRFDFNLGS